MRTSNTRSSCRSSDAPAPPLSKGGQGGFARPHEANAQANPSQHAASAAPLAAAPRRTCVVVLQPSYLPWLGCFDQLARSDVFVLYDDVQFDKNGWRNRNRIKTPAGPQWLTVPVLTRGRFGQTIRETCIDPAQNWADKHLHALETNYRRAPHFELVRDAIAPILRERLQSLADLNERLFRRLADLLGLQRRILVSSQLGIEGDRTGRLLGICKSVGATHYLSGAAARDYLDPAPFRDAGIDVEFQDYRHPVYPQLHGPFVPYLSVVDLLMNLGPASREVLVNGQAAR